MITITKAAAEQILKSSQDSKAENMALRLAVKTKDDGSFHYAMGFDDVENGADFTTTSHDVTVVVDKGSQSLVQGMTLDFVELEPGQFSFIFVNPNDPNYKAPEND